MKILLQINKINGCPILEGGWYLEPLGRELMALEPVSQIAKFSETYGADNCAEQF